MKKAYLALLSAAVAMTSTACGTISPPVQTPPETAVTEAAEPTAEPTIPVETVNRSEEEQIKSNTFIAEFFDSNIMFTDVQKFTDDSLKDCTFEKQAESSNGIQKISLKRTFLCMTGWR